MEFFLDTAIIEEIKKAAEWGLLDGVTTNPSLVKKTGKTFDEVAREIVEFVKGPVSLEVVAEDSETIIKEARQLSKRGDNVVVKVPMTEEGVKAIQVLSKEGVKTNCTLVFSANQALIAAKAGATYVSPFLGRIDDAGGDGIQLIYDIREIFDNYGLQTKIIAASLRHPTHIMEMAKAGADISTIPFGVLKKLFKHPLTDAGIKSFLKDWENVPKGKWP